MLDKLVNALNNPTAVAVMRVAVLVIVVMIIIMHVIPYFRKEGLVSNVFPAEMNAPTIPESNYLKGTSIGSSAAWSALRSDTGSSDSMVGSRGEPDFWTVDHIVERSRLDPDVPADTILADAAASSAASEGFRDQPYGYMVKPTVVEGMNGGRSGWRAADRTLECAMVGTSC